MDELTSRFIGAFNEIHHLLRKLCDAGSNAEFSKVLKQAAQKSSTVRTYDRELIELNELRNAIIHRYLPDEPIATPCLWAVKRLEAIRDILQAPPKLGSIFRAAVNTCSPDAPIADVVAQMRDCGFSQIPVYKDSGLLALLTTDTIARWLAVCLKRDGGILDDVQVQAVLPHAEVSDNYAFLDPLDTVCDALECILTREKQGKRWDAILITQGRSKTAKPLGIITASDIRRLYEEIR